MKRLRQVTEYVYCGVRCVPIIWNQDTNLQQEIEHQGYGLNQLLDWERAEAVSLFSDLDMEDALNSVCELSQKRNCTISHKFMALHQDPDTQTLLLVSVEKTEVEGYHRITTEPLTQATEKEPVVVFILIKPYGND